MCRNLKALQFPLDIHTKWVYNSIVRQGQNPLRKEGGQMQEPMTESQTIKLVEWLKAQGMTDSQIVDCITYINKR